MTELIFWGSIFVVMVIAETATTQLVSIWFAVGSAAAFVAKLFGAPVVLQVVLFIVFSVGLLLVTRPILKRVKTTPEPTNADTVVGTKGIVIEQINNLTEQGRVKANGLTWNARTEDNSILEPGDIVEIMEINGVTVTVKPSSDQTLSIR